MMLLKILMSFNSINKFRWKYVLFLKYPQLLLNLIKCIFDGILQKRKVKYFGDKETFNVHIYAINTSFQNMHVYINYNYLLVYYKIFYVEIELELVLSSQCYSGNSFKTFTSQPSFSLWIITIYQKLSLSRYNLKS